MSAATEQSFDSPLGELETLLDRMEHTLEQARAQAAEKLAKERQAANKDDTTSTDTTPTKSSGFTSSLFSGFRLRSKKKEETNNSNHSEEASNKVQPPPSSTGSSSLAAAAAASTSSSQHGDDVIDELNTSAVSQTSSTIEASTSASAQFIDIPNLQQFVEDLRRISELVVLGENYITSQEKKRAEKLKRAQARWRTDRDSVELSSDEEDDDDDDNNNHAPQQSPQYADLFDLFFERDALELIVNMLTGRVFESLSLPEEDQQEEGEREQNLNIINDTKITWLPPLDIATQAVQSVSILIQNVSRATSLYIILSNDFINSLISLPLEQYEAAERHKRQVQGDESRAIFSSPAMAELSTHFVTFLKSLALRMNVETLQFFLKYPAETGVAGGAPVSSAHWDSNENDDAQGAGATATKGTGNDVDANAGDLPTLSTSKASSPVSAPRKLSADALLLQEHLRVEFPLYERALEFCAAHQDSFVRVTAMNICLNTLRLTTVSPDPPTEEDTGENLEGGDETSSPRKNAVTRQGAQTSAAVGAAVLHSAKALPFRERLAIAKYTCTPTRVERLVAPIFTKLSERWSALDEAIRAMNANKDQSSASMMDKVSHAKEKVRRERLVWTFKEKAADLQDELLLLEDVFKVGLTVLNEQLIEMMLATFVYPMLLQPLLIFYQRFSATIDKSRNAFYDHHPLEGYAGDHGDAEALLTSVSGPAKTSLFTVAAVFQTLSNPALLRLLYTALFHPLSPDSTSVPTVRSTLQVATLDRHGRATIRVDPFVTEQEQNNQHGDRPMIPNDRSTYDFGTVSTNRRLSKSKAVDLQEVEEKEACVFVLAPALAEVLEFKGQSLGFMTRTRPNSYRHALLQCLDVPVEFAEVRALAASTFDAALSVFDSRFAAELLFGSDLKTFEDDMPLDERNLDSEYAHAADHRDLGGSAAHESRHSVARQKGGPVGKNLVQEVVSALSTGILHATRPDSNSPWVLQFDEVAAHAMLSAVKGHARAMVDASKTLELQWRKAATYVAEQPGAIHSPMGGSSLPQMPGAPTVNDFDYDDKMHGMIFNCMLFDARPGRTPVMQSFLRLRETAAQAEREGASLAVSSTCDFDGMCQRVGAFVLASKNDNDGTATAASSNDDLELARETTLAFFKVDALVSLLKDLSVTGGLQLTNINFDGVAFSTEGTFVQTMEYDLAKNVFAPISSSLAATIFGTTAAAGQEEEMPEPGSVVHLAGYPAIPCVCEVPGSLAPLFTPDSTGVVAEGVTWQSLYLVFMKSWLIFAQPLTGGAVGGGGDGRVVGVCRLERIAVEPDPAAPDGSPARRLLLSHSWFDAQTPGLFLFDALPKPQEIGPFVRVKPFTSRLDVWFEHGRAADHAYRIVSSQIFDAKSQRGRRIQEFLSPSVVATSPS